MPERARKKTTNMTSSDARIVTTVRLFRYSWDTLLDSMRASMEGSFSQLTARHLLEQSPVLEYIASLKTVYPEFSDIELQVIALQRLRLSAIAIADLLTDRGLNTQEFLSELDMKLGALGTANTDNVHTLT